MMPGVAFWDMMVVFAKALSYVGALGAAGGVFFLAYSHSLLEAASGRKIRRWIGALLAVTALASGAKVLATAASMSGGATGMLDAALDAMILRSGEGRAIAARLVGLACAAWAIAPRRPSAVALLGAVVLATSFAWVGHVHARASALPTLLLGAHLLAASFWLGALVPLALVARGTDVSRVARVTSRFGAAALLVVLALLGAGVTILCLLLHSVSALWDDDYGRLVLLKLGSVALLLGLAAFNHLRITPRLRAREPRAAATLSISIALEITVACAVLMITAAMTTLTGP